MKKTHYLCTHSQAYVMRPGPIAFSQLYQTVYSLYLSSLVMVFIPFTLLLVGNFAIAISITRKAKARQGLVSVRLYRIAINLVSQSVQVDVGFG